MPALLGYYHTLYTKSPAFKAEMYIDVRTDPCSSFRAEDTKANAIVKVVSVNEITWSTETCGATSGVSSALPGITGKTTSD